MEPAKRYSPAPEIREWEAEAEKARREQLETMIGKAIFYVTAAVAIWFFYWLNGIQCPC